MKKPHFKWDADRVCSMFDIFFHILASIAAVDLLIKLLRS